MGYMEVPRLELVKLGHDVEVLYYGMPPLKFEYKNFSQRLISFLRKINGNSIKKKYRENVIREFTASKHYHKILVTHPQYLNAKTHIYLKSICENYMVYLFDSLKKISAQKHYIRFFDKVFSYEMEDCEVHNFIFITNFIPTERFRNSENSHRLFNISCKDVRYNKLKALAKYCKKNNIPGQFILFSKKPLKSPLFTIIPNKVNIQEIDVYMKDTGIFVDVQRPEQNGLSFRVFEAMGNEKKLITDNSYIRKYPFYDPNNIHIIDFHKLEIPKKFLSTPYHKIDPDLYNRYTAGRWVKEIFSLE